MAQQTLANGASYGTQRTKINENFAELYSAAATVATEAERANNEFDTVSAAVAAITSSPTLYSQVRIKERANSFWDVVSGETADGFGIIAAGAKQLKLNATGVVSSKMYGIPLGAGVSQNAAIKAFLERGGNLNFEAGDYLISSQGANVDGVLVSSFKKNLNVTCSQGVKFIIDGVDGDGIRIEVPSNGVGLPAGGISVAWNGGKFDQTTQKVSTVVPFLVEYPAPIGLAGTTATSDALSIRGEYNDGAEKHGIVFCHVDGVETYAGEHWQIAGGDSGIFVAGCKKQIVENCIGTGNRDCHIYTSGTELGTLECDTEIKNNTAISCFHGHASKRSATVLLLSNNAKNCNRAALVDDISGVGVGAAKSRIAFNTSESCNVGVYAENCHGVVVTGNIANNVGSLLSDGTSVEPLTGGSYFAAYGCSFGVFDHNYALGVKSAYNTIYTGNSNLLICEDLYGLNSTNMVFERNVGDGFKRCGQDNGNDNSFVANVVYNAVTSSGMTVIGTRGYETKVDTATNNVSFKQPVLCPDGASSAPAVARASQPSVGMRFATNAMHLHVSGNDRVSCNNVGIGFNNSTPIAKPTITGSTGGNATLQSLLTAMESYGLITDSTT